MGWCSALSPKPSWECNSIISDTRIFAHQNEISFSHVKREGNKVANWIARLVLRLVPIFTVPFVIPRDLKSLVDSDSVMVCSLFCYPPCKLCFKKKSLSLSTIF